jgi:hypothetical protein
MLRLARLAEILTAKHPTRAAGRRTSEAP